MNVLITGGTGNLGSRLVIPMVQRGNKVAVFDTRPQPHFDSAEFRSVDVILGDLADRNAVLQAILSHKIEAIFHLGAMLSSDAEEDPYRAWGVNMDGMVNVLDAARMGGTQKVIFSSTIATYGVHLEDPLRDDSPQWPLSLYGVTKVAGERLGVYYQHRFGLDFRAIRLPVVVAARGSGGGASAYCSAVFEGCVFKGNYDFYVRPTTRAPMLYVADAVRGLVALHDAPVGKLTRSVYNIAGISASAEELATSVRTLVPAAHITYTPDPLRSTIVESWPKHIDDLDARQDWGWKADWQLDRMANEIVGVLQDELARK